MTKESRSSLLPREHGAWGQLLFPMLSVVLAGWNSISSWAFAMSAWGFFLGHEPWLVWLGHRGQKAKKEEANRALRWLVVSVSGAAALGFVGLVTMRAESRWAIAPPAAFAGVVAALAFRKQEKTLLGESLAACAMSGISMPMVLASHGTTREALALWIPWALGLTASTAAVRSILDRKKGRSDGWNRTVLLLCSAIGVLGGRWLHPALWGVMPLLTISWIVWATNPSTRHLKRLGWSLVAGSILTLGAIVVLVRIGE